MINIIKAIKRQIAKKPDWYPTYQSYYSAGDEAEPIYPECGTEIEDKTNYCYHCGQKIQYV